MRAFLLIGAALLCWSTEGRASTRTVAQRNNSIRPAHIIEQEASILWQRFESVRGSNTAEVLKIYSSIESLRKAVDRDSPLFIDLTMKSTEALLSYVRTETGANIPRVDAFTNTTAACRQLCRKWSPVIMEHLQELRDVDDAIVLVWNVEAVTYRMVANGIFGSMMKPGDLVHLVIGMRQLSKYPLFEGGLTYLIEGCYYLNAPWPLGGATKARKSFENAYRISPSLRNKYFVGLGYFAEGRKEEAILAFEAVATAIPMVPSERDIERLQRTESLRVLKMLKRERITA